MKKTTLSLAIMTTLIAAAPLAQAEVELYGKASAGFEKTYTHDSKTSGVRDHGSYIGFRGNEKLSNQAKAIWQVEQGVSLDGSDKELSYQDLMRDSYVGLQHDSLGTVRVGKNSSSYKDVGGELDLFKEQTASVESGFGRLNERVTNSVKYDTPDIYGANGSVTYGKVSNPLNETDEKSDVYAAGLNYSNNGFNIGAGYERQKGIYGKKDYLYGVKAATSYKFMNGALVGVGAERLVYNPKQEASPSFKQNAVSVSGLYPVGPVDLKGNYTRVFNASGLDNSGANIYTAGAQYNFSKRTSAGSYFSMIDNDKYGSNGFQYNDVFANGDVKPGETVRTFGANISHKF